MLTGAVPFGGSAIEVMLAHLSSEPPPLPAPVPPEVAALVRALLAKRPEDRPGPAGALAEALNRMAAAAWQRAGEVDPSGATFAAMAVTPPPLPPVVRGRGWGRWGAGGVGVAVIAAAVVIAGHGGAGDGGAVGGASDAGVRDGAVVIDAGVAVIDGAVDGGGAVVDGEPDVAMVVDGGWAMRATRPRAPTVGRPTTLALEIWDEDGDPAQAGSLAFIVTEPDGASRPADVARKNGRFELTLTPRLPGPYVVTVFAPEGETTLAVALDVARAP